jgi:hypothetical protein
MSNTYSQNSNAYQSTPSYTSYTPYEPNKVSNYSYSPSYVEPPKEYNQANYSYKKDTLAYESKPRYQMNHSGSGKLSFTDKSKL